MRKKDDKKIEVIKNAVIKLILQYGFHGTSISKIAKEAGVSPATIYIYYENKEIMIHEIYHQLRMERHNFVHGNITSHMDAKETLKTIFKSDYNYVIKHEEEFFFIKQFSSCPCMYEEAKTQQYSMKLNGLIDKFKENNEIKDVNNKIIISLLLSPIESIAENFFGGGINFSEEEINQVFEMVWSAISL